MFPLSWTVKGQSPGTSAVQPNRQGLGCLHPPRGSDMPVGDHHGLMLPTV